MSFNVHRVSLLQDKKLQRKVVMMAAQYYESKFKTVKVINFVICILPQDGEKTRDKDLEVLSLCKNIVRRWLSLNPKMVSHQRSQSAP